MKKYVTIVFICVFLMILLILAITVNRKIRETQINLDVCSAISSESMESLNTHIEYKRTISILNITFS